MAKLFVDLCGALGQAVGWLLAGLILGCFLGITAASAVFIFRMFS